MKSYPIWVDINSCSYKSPNKSYGVKETGEQNIYVGSSAQNSNEFINVRITKREGYDESGNSTITFRYSADGVVLKEAIFESKNGRATNHIKTISKLKKLKSL